MKNLLFIALISGVVFAQDCPSGGCKMEKPAEAKASLSARIDKLDASAAKGCETSKETLASLYEAAKVDSTDALKEKVALCEQYAGQGCGVSKAVLAKLDASLGAPKKGQKGPMPLSMRLTKMDQGCAKGCEKSTAAMATLVKQYEVADATALIALVQTWETKADNGCASCTEKLTVLATQMPARKMSLSRRIAKLDSSCTKGCETSKAKMETLLKEYEAKDAKALVAMVQTWETKAGNGCGKCKEKLTTLSTRLPMPKAMASPAAAKPATEKKEAGCTDCGDCTGCTDCGDCPEGGRGCEMEKPTNTKQ